MVTPNVFLWRYHSETVMSCSVIESSPVQLQLLRAFSVFTECIEKPCSQSQNISTIINAQSVPRIAITSKMHKKILFTCSVGNNKGNRDQRQYHFCSLTAGAVPTTEALTHAT